MSGFSTHCCVAGRGKNLPREIHTLRQGTPASRRDVRLCLRIETRHEQHRWFRWCLLSPDHVTFFTSACFTVRRLVGLASVVITTTDAKMKAAAMTERRERGSFANAQPRNIATTGFTYA